ncbi:MAG: InlB B-repeat-containing protein [Evtepia sp.]|nr:InlB B-repeat-containing protein [Evtepia sp.]
MYDETFEGSTGNSLRVVKKSESGDSTPERLNAAQYTLQVGLPDDPARDAGRHVLVATDGTGKYVAIGAIRIGQNEIDIVKVEPENGAIYTGKRIDPKLTVKGSGGKILVEGRDYTVSIYREVKPATGSTTTEPELVATNLILNADTYRIVVAGKGNYSGTDSIPFTVHPKSLDNKDVEEIVDHPKVVIDVSTYNLGITRPRAVLTYNGMMLSPGGDYEQIFLTEDGKPGSENNPDQITFNGQGNYTGTKTVEVKTVTLPNGDLKIEDSNNEYVYQATDLFGYLNFQDLNIEEVKREANRLEPSFDNYEVKIASLEDYYKTSDGDDSTLVPAKYKILDMGGYVVKMTQEKDPNKFGYFFMRVTPRPVTVTVKDNSKIYGDDIPTFTYETNLSTLVGENERDGAAGEIGESGFFLYDEEKPENYPTGTLYRAEGEDVGNYYYSLNTFTAGPNYILTVSSDTMFSIHPKSLCEVEDDDPKPEQPADGIKVTCKNQVEYTGYPVTPLESLTFQAPLASLGTQTLHESRDYTLTYYRNNGTTETPNWSQLSAAPIAVGEYKVVITGMGNYTNQLEQTFSVVTAGKTLQVEIPDNQVTYKADAYRPKVTVKTEGGAALNSNNYSMTYSYTDTTGKTVTESETFASASTEFINAGTYTIHVNGTGNYAGAFGEATFTVKAKDLAEGNTDGGTTDVKVDPIAGKTYTGKAITFSGGLNDVTYAGLSTGGLTPHAELTYGTDYNLTYIDNTNAGTATAVLVGAGNYTGSRAVKFEIEPKDIYVAVGNTVKVYGENDPEYSYEVYEKSTEEGGVDDPSEYKPLQGINVTGKPGRVAGENAGTYALNLDEGSTLSAGPNYTIHLKNSELKDNPVLTIQKKAIGTGNQTAAERIVATIAYVEAKDGATWPVPEVTYWKEKGSEKLDPNTHFTVKYYKQDGTEVGPNTAITQDSVGSYYAIVTAKGTNYSKSIKLPFMVVKEGSYLALTANGGGVYNPDGGTATLTAMFGEKDVTSAASYTVICYPTAGSSQTIEVTKTDDIASFKTGDAGTYVIQAEYSDTVGDTPTAAFGSTTVVVTPKTIENSMVSAIPEQPYTGNAVVPKLTIEDGEKTLELGKDYTISVTDNVQPGATAKVTITGMGNYTGTTTKTFQIGPMQYTLKYDANGGNAESLPADAHSQGTFSVASGSGMTHDKSTVGDKEYPVLFVGWSQENDNGKIYKKGDNLPAMIYAGQTLRPEKTLTTLYAIWGYDTDGDGRADVVQSTVKVVYDKGIATGTPPTDDQTYLIGAMATAKDEGSLTYKKDNVEYVFMGWTPTAQAQNGQGEDTVKYAVDNLSDYVKLGSVYATGASFYVGNPSNGAFNLYPVWGADSDNNEVPDFLEGNILLIYDANGGVGAPAAQECKVGDKVILAGAQNDAPTRNGAVFLGWTENPEKLLTTPPKVNHLPGSEYEVKKPDGVTKYTTLYALWAKDENGNGKPDYEEARYTVTYEANGGQDGPTDNGQYLPDTTVTVLKGPTRDGYTFAGWKLNDTTYQPGQTFTITGDTTLTAVWTEIGKVKVTYHLSDSTTEESEPVERGNPVELRSSEGLTKEGYTFLGWTPGEKEKIFNTAEDIGDGDLGHLYQPGESLTLTDNVDLSPLWVKNELLLTHRLLSYRANGGEDSKIASTAFLLGKDATHTIVTDEPTREGYTFDGWKIDGEDTVYGKNGTKTYTVGDANVTFMAQWTANKTFTVTYKANGAEGVTVPTDNTAYQKDATVTVKNGLTREDYTFNGWNTQADGKGTLYQPGATFTITGDTTLYAMWTANVAHTVTYDLNGGTGTAPVDNNTYSPGKTVKVLEGKDLTKEGAQFAGWSTVEYKDTLTDLSQVKILYGKDGTFLMGSEDVKLFAVWATPEAMSVFYKMNFDFTVAGSSTRDQIATLPSEMFFKPSSTVNIKALQPYDLKDGYVFCGWSENKDSTTTIQDPNITITKDTTLYAVFATKTCQVYTQAGTGGSITPSATVAHGSDFTVTVTVNSGYQLDKVTVNGAEVTLDSTNSYTITKITKDTYVMVTFTKISSSKPTPTPDPDPKPVTPDDTGVSSILNTKDHDPFLFGYPNGTFGPERSITRAEVAQMFYNLLLKKDVPITVQFEDVPENAWYAQAVNTLASMGMINGVGSDRYEPERAITRAEFSAIATRFGKKTTAAKTTFVDVPESHWAYQYINVVASYGWVSGYGGNLFGPDDLITRAQAATMTNRMLGRLCDNDAIDRGEGRVFPDVTNAHWAWYQIAEATTEHDFTINKDYTAETWKK